MLQSTNFSPRDTDCASGVQGNLVVQTEAPQDLEFSLLKSGSWDCCLCAIVPFVVYHLHPRLQSWGLLAGSGLWVSSGWPAKYVPDKYFQVM